MDFDAQNVLRARDILSLLAEGTSTADTGRAREIEVDDSVRTLPGTVEDLTK